MMIHQTNGNRYLPGWNYNTPVDNFGMCGTSCHPGRGVMEAGAKQVVTSCGCCYNVLKMRYPEGAYKIQCFLKYSPNYDWRFDLGAMWQGGSSRRAFLPSGESTRWNDEMYFRITYSF